MLVAFKKQSGTQSPVGCSGFDSQSFLRGDLIGVKVVHDQAGGGWRLIEGGTFPVVRRGEKITETTKITLGDITEKVETVLLSIWQSSGYQM